MPLKLGIIKTHLAYTNPPQSIEPLKLKTLNLFLELSGIIPFSAYNIRKIVDSIIQLLNVVLHQ